jgi:hypothetical protein
MTNRSSGPSRKLGCFFGRAARREHPCHLEDTEPDHPGVTNQLEHHVLGEGTPSSASFSPTDSMNTMMLAARPASMVGCPQKLPLVASYPGMKHAGHLSSYERKPANSFEVKMEARDSQIFLQMLY